MNPHTITSFNFMVQGGAGYNKYNNLLQTSEIIQDDKNIKS
jgi:hypothetical protein